MLRKIIICLIITLVNSEECNLDKKEVLDLQESLKNATDYMKSEVKDDDDDNALICIGTTKSGKSTLINFLIGNKLIGKRLSFTGAIKLIKLDNETLGPEIGNSVMSTSTIPSKWKSSRLPNLTIWDSPGFADNRGIERDITNAYYIFQLMKHVKSLRFILMIDFHVFIKENTKDFFSILHHLDEFFGSNFQDMFPSFTLIFSKAPDSYNNHPVNSTFIKTVLEESFFSQSTLKMPHMSKEFLQFLVNNSQFAFFRRPNHEGAFTYNESDNIFQSIEKSKSIKRSIIEDFRPTISSNSKSCLFSLRDEILSLSELSHLDEVVEKIYSEKLNNVSTTWRNADSDAKHSFKDELNESLHVVNNALDEKISFSQRIEIIEEIDVRVQKVIENNNLLEKMKLLEFYDYLLNTQLKKQYEGVLKIILRTYSYKILHLINGVNQENITILSSMLQDVTDAEKENENQGYFNIVLKTIIRMFKGMIDALRNFNA